MLYIWHRITSRHDQWQLALDVCTVHVFYSFVSTKRWLRTIDIRAWSDKCRDRIWQHRERERTVSQLVSRLVYWRSKMRCYIPNLILGVCIQLRLRDQVIGVFISVYTTSLSQVNFTTYTIILLHISVVRVVVSHDTTHSDTRTRNNSTRSRDTAQHGEGRTIPTNRKHEAKTSPITATISTNASSY
jgi:hypothetical protein